MPESFFVDAEYESAFKDMGLSSTDAVFSFNAGRNLSKNNLAVYRSRLQFEIGSPATTMFLKRYDKPPVMVQLRNWLNRRGRVSCGFFEVEPAAELMQAGIGSPKIIAKGEKWGMLFEQGSFTITEKIPEAESLERKLPACFTGPASGETIKARRAFIRELAELIKRFHASGYRHRDLYLCHIFYGQGKFYLIDLARTFKPILFSERFRVKDIAQLYYSAPGVYFSKLDRLRFYLGYTGKNRLDAEDKRFIRKVKTKTARIARHDRKHGRVVPFEN